MTSRAGLRASTLEGRVNTAFDAVRLVSTSPAFEYANVSAVPLPASAPLFGAALMALGAVGYGLKRKGKAAIAA